MTPPGRHVSDPSASRRPEDDGAQRRPKHPRDPSSETLDGGTVIGLPGVSESNTDGGRARFEGAEIRRVLDAYPLGEVTGIQEFPAGSRQAPKVRVSSTEGEYLLKRRVARSELVERAIFNHGFQLHLEGCGVPVARLVGTRRENRSMLLEDDRVYELFEWIDGRRLVKAAPEVRNAGRILGRLHEAGSSFHPPKTSDLAGFHAATSVSLAFDRLGSAILAADVSLDAQAVSDRVGDLRCRLEQAREQVEAAGWGDLPRQPIHGDWHPGNLLFTPSSPTLRQPGVVRAIVDFDASRIEPRIVDLANGLLHFAMRSQRDRSPAEWPPSLSPDRIRAMIEGWREASGTTLSLESEVLPPLMIEALIAESIVPIARSGTFAGVPGFAFLGMVLEKVRWIERHGSEIGALLRD